MRVRKAYIVFVHDKPLQLSRLVSKLDDNQSKFFIHVDKRRKISEFSSVLNTKSDSIEFIRQEYSVWGGIGIIRAAINAFFQIKCDKNKYDFILSLSGQDYPIKSNAYINNYLEENIEKIFIENERMPTSFWPSGGLDRISKFHIGNRKNPNLISKVINILVNNVLGLSPFFCRQEFLKMNYYGGSSWWTINTVSLEYILDYITKNPSFLRCLRYSLSPDEMFFHTILLNSENESIKDRIINHNLHYIDWSEKKQSPSILCVKDYSRLIQSDKLFARKFDVSIDSIILDLLDSHNCIGFK